MTTSEVMMVMTAAAAAAAVVTAVMVRVVTVGDGSLCLEIRNGDADCVCSSGSIR